MIAAPRLATVGMKSSSSQDWSFTLSAALSPFTLAWKMSGYWVGEWLPHTVMLVTSPAPTSALRASWAIARL